VRISDLSSWHAYAKPVSIVPYKP